MTALFAYTICIVSIISRMARCVNLQRLLPICPSRRSLCSFAALAIRSPIIALMTLPIVLRREIGLYPLGVYVTTLGFPTLRSTTIRAFRNHYRKQPSVKLTVVIFASIQCKGFPYILRNPISSRSFLRAFHTLSFYRVFAISSLVTYCLIQTISIQVSSLKSMSLISYRLAYS